MLDRFFQISAAGSSVRRELFGGLATFLTMSYIIFVNPAILSAAGMDKGALVTATILASVLGTVLAGLWAKLPLAMAPGMGLNAFFTYSLVIGHKLSWQTALGAVFLSGCLFFILSISGARKRIVAAIPDSLRTAIPAGIGLLIAFVGLKGMGLITGHKETLVALGKFTPEVLLGLGGTVLVFILLARRIPGAILIGILAVTGAALLTGRVTAPGTLVSMPAPLTPLFLQLDIGGALQFGLVGAIFSLMFVDLFDSVGTIVACAGEAGMIREDGSIPRLDRILEADAVATMGGALLGTSTTTTYVESVAGIENGARTGLASLVTGGLLLLMLFFSPVIAFVPGYATAPALVAAVPVFLSILIMPLTSSISMGLAFGFLSHTILSVVTGRGRTISLVLWIITGLAALQIVVEAVR
jgi:AGZA family xanthine/uracil permease-like MFS transporter